MRLKRKLFARKDYYHLSQSEAEILNKQRNDLAKEVWKKRKQALADKASYDVAALGDKKILDANKNALSSNYKSILKDTKASAERLRNNALENKTSTLIGKETNSFAKTPTKPSIIKTSSTPTSTPKLTPLPDLPKPEPIEKYIKEGTKVQKPTVSITPNKVKKGSVFNGSFNPMKWSKNAKIGGGIVLGATALGTGAYLAKKHYDKKKDKKD